MKISFKTLLVLAAFGSFATTSCSEKKAEDTATNAGDAMGNAADSVKADTAREPGDTAVVLYQPAHKVVEQMPAPPQK